MGFFKYIIGSTVGKKFLMAITGLALSLFLVGHLVGNLQLLLPHGEHFNRYAHFLTGLGELLLLVEAGLLAAFLIHIAFAWQTWSISKAARGSEAYMVEQTKGGDSKANFASKNMLVFGMILLVFVVVHLLHFKFGAFDSDPREVVYPRTVAVTADAAHGAAHGATSEYVGGVEMRDLHYLVVKDFKNPLWVLFYTACMVALGFHLRHGLWSMFQSIGAMPRKYSTPLYCIGGLIALALAAGFIFLPFFILIDPFGFFTEIAEQAAQAAGH